MDSHLPVGFVSVDQKSDVQIAMENLAHYLMLEKQKAWKEGFTACQKIHEEARR